MLIDLQLHSTYSDGYLTPAAVADFLLKNKIKAASLTDHNTVAGQEEFRLACQKNGLKPIIGLEIYAKLNYKKFNLLWYNFDHKDARLREFLRPSQARRRERMRRALLKLKTLGLLIDVNKILNKYGHYVPLNRVIDDVWRITNNRQKIAERLNAQRPSEEKIIKFFFSNRKINKLGESYVDFRNILKLREKIGGQLILNHPGKNAPINEIFIDRLVKLGLDGIELISPHHSISDVMRLQRLIKHHQLIATGGSDYHLDEVGRIPIKNAYSYFKVDDLFLPGIKKIING